MVLLEKHVHLQNDGGAEFISHRYSAGQYMWTYRLLKQTGRKRKPRR
jgi:hypothetical protein